MRALITITFLAAANFAFAQTGPGGVGNAATNVLWLSADNGVYSDAGVTPAVNTNNVVQWNDRSGNGRDATHPTAAERPNYQTNVVNGFPVLRFSNANNDRLLSSGLTISNAASVWAIASYSSLPAPNPGILQGSPLGSGISTSTADKSIGMWVSSAAGTRVWGRGVQSNNSSIDIPQVTTLNSGTFYTLMNRYDGISNISQYVNGTVAGSVAYNGTLKSWADFGIGRQGTESWNGDIAEVIVYNIAVNSAQRIIVGNYLAAKYGLATGSDVYTMDNAGNGNYDYEVAGIGRIDASNIHSDAQGSGIVRILNPTDLENNEFLMWGHDNGVLQANNTTDIPAGVTSRFNRTWRVSESGGDSDVGSIDIQFDLTGISDFSGLSSCDAALAIRLLVDTNGDGLFADQTPISGATNIGGNIFRFTSVNALTNGARFTLGIYHQAVTGPGGVGSHDGVSSLKLWFRTDNGINVTSSSVDSWTNSAGIAALDIAETGTQRPTLVPNAVNGFSEVSFNGTNRLRTGLTLTPANFVSDEASSFMVCRADNTTQTSSVYMTDPLEINRFANHIPWAGTVYYDIGNCCGNDARLDVPALTGLTAYSVWSYDANPVSGKQLYRSGSLLQDRALTSVYTSHATHRFNIGANTSGSNGFEGDITEVIIYAAKVNSAQRIIIENYLAAKYGLALTANDIYRRDNGGQGNFDFDVAGIGRVDASNMHTDARGTGMVRVSNPSDLGDNEFFVWGHDNGSLSTINTTDVPAGVQGRLNRVWRVSEVDIAAVAVNVGTLDLQFDLSSLGSPITTSDLRLLIDHNGDGNFSEAGTLVIGGAVALACENYLFSAVPSNASGITNGDRFTIGTINISQTPLPIQLVAFAGEVDDGNVHLSWATASEIDNDFFTIERSLNGKDFISAGNVPGSGTTHEKVDYRFVDEFVPYGRLYYRLKQTDFDGAHSYSDVISLENKPQGTKLIAVPNPVGSDERIRLRIMHAEQVDPKNVELSVHDMFGRKIGFRYETETDGEIMVDLVKAEASGIYIITLRSPQLKTSLFTRVQLLR